MRSALIGAIVGVLGVVGCFTFRAGLADAAASPQRSGVVWDFTIASGLGPLSSEKLATITQDRDTDAVMHAVWYRAVRIHGVATPTFGISTLKGDIAPVVLDGRVPARPDEIVFGPGTLRELKLHVGDKVTVGEAPGVRATVVGTALVPVPSHTDYDQSVWMTADGVERLVGPLAKLDSNGYEDYTFIRWKPGVRDATAENESGSGSVASARTPSSTRRPRSFRSRS